MSAVIRALEVGFGTTSLVKNVVEGQPELMTFPSLVSQVDKNKSSINAGINKRNTVTVDVDGTSYEVGPDAGLAAGKKTARVLNSSYVNSQQYKALLFGSLVYMNVDVIDLLVLGLPVDNWKRKEELKNFVVGEHVIGGRKFIIKDVWVIVQPMGGLLQHANSLGQEGYNEMRDMTVLSVDPGYGTFDFCVSNGLKVNESLSDGFDLGMSAVLDAVSKNLKNVFSTLGDINIERIDEAFWKNNGFIRLAGKKYPFPICRGQDVNGNPVPVEFDVTRAIEEVTDSAITTMVNKVGNGADIDKIILMGGPAKVYLPALKRAYPSHDIEVLDEGLQAVCKGMFLGGKQFYQLLQKNKAA